MIEITHGQSLYMYRLRPGDPRIVERRKNGRGGRWKLYQIFGTAEQARWALWEIERQPEEKNSGNLTK